VTTGIEWTDRTWNPLAAFDRETGERGWFCTKVSPGCHHCYAEAMNRWAGTGHDYTVPNLEEIEFRLVNLDRPLEWQRSGWGGRVFVNSMTDLFHEEVPDEMIDRVFASMALAPDLTFQILTKRPGRMAEYMKDADWGEDANALTDEYIRPLSGDLYLAHEVVPPLPNVWLGTSVEDQERADERIPLLQRTTAAVRFLSCEPLLGRINLGYRGAGAFPITPLGQRVKPIEGRPEIDWVIVGGESGPGARPMMLDWVLKIIEQCEQAGAPVFVKQLGSDWARREGASHSKGEDPEEWPSVLRRREFPEVVQEEVP
jgi:protein gp37